MTNTLLVEASLFAYDTFASVADYPSTPALPKLPTGNAVDRGWTPLGLAGLASPGVDLADVGALVGMPGLFTSAAHFYTGDLEGRNTLVVTYRSTDEPNEFGFQGVSLPPNPFGAEYGWDLYFGAHQAATVAALSYAANPANGVEQVLISGHSLGGIIAELSAARLVGAGAPFADLLADKTLLVTLGSPGSTEVVEGVEQVNVVHTDDFVARLSALSPLFIAGGAAREGLDLAVDRPEATLPRFRPKDLDTPEELLAASAIPGIGAEHPSLLYIDTAALLASAEPYVPGVQDAEPGDMFRWLSTDLDRIIVGTDDAESIRVGKGNGLVFARDGNDTVRGQKGDDVLMAMAGDNLLDGGPGNDVLVGGLGDDKLRGGAGDDLIYLFGGRDEVDGGAGRDMAVFAGDLADFDLTVVNRKIVQVSGDGLDATLRKVELFRFDDQELLFDGRELTPVTSLLTASAVQDFLGLDGEIA
jgi:hypothetical protein